MGAGEKRLSQRYASHACSSCVAVLILSAFLVLVSCSTSPTTSTITATSNPATTATPTLVPTATSTALPIATQVGQVAGWQTLNSLHWVGYTFPDGNVTGVRAQWKEPNVNGMAGTEEFIWIGLGGWDYTSNNIIQVGTFAYFPPEGGLHQGIWYELVPVQQKAQFPLIDVSPGDQIFASVTELQPPQQNWQVLLVDVTTGATFRKVVQFDSRIAYPSFVVEDPNVGSPSPGGPFYPFPHWGSVSFSNMQIRINGTWTSAAALYGYRVLMVRNGQTLATADPLSTSSSFSATQQ